MRQESGVREKTLVHHYYSSCLNLTSQERISATGLHLINSTWDIIAFTGNLTFIKALTDFKTSASVSFVANVQCGTQ